MCGFAGIYNDNEVRAVEEMMAAISHRGPDGKGLWWDAHHALGHTRLSILDAEGGAQPMSALGGHSHIVYNGEIYNHDQLRDGMGRYLFRTRSDTEVVQQLHLEDPAGHVGKLDGMFAYAVVKDDQLTLARDPLGIKPLYVGRRNQTLAFASEMKALLKVCERIWEFPPGHIYVSREGLRRYFDFPSPHAHADVEDFSRAVEGVRERLEDAVFKRLMADVPVGVFLSGGLDSSLIAALAARYKQPLDSFSVGTADSPDRAFAQQAAGFIGTRHHEYVYTLKEALRALPQVIYYLESFDCALVRSAIPNFFLARLAGQHVKVALSGEGADELFAGYDYLKEIPPADLPAELAQITRDLHHTNLQRCDRMSMAHGLEVRVPFLDLRLVDFAFRIPVSFKLHGEDRIEKWVLRKAAGTLLPDEIVWRKKAKFAIGCGLGDGMARFAEREIDDTAFAREREVADGVFLRSKEELLYYRIFRQFYPPDKVLRLVGRSRSV